MNQDTLPTAQLERGFRTLTHDWRNVLNGINLCVMSANLAEAPEERAADLAEVSELIGNATKMLAAVALKLLPPVVAPIRYPTSHLVEDLQISIKRMFGARAADFTWQMTSGSRSALVDFDAFHNALCELLGNSLRYLPEGSVITIRSGEVADTFCLDLEEEKHGGVLSEGWGVTPFHTTERDRLGLGLYYANRVMNALGGKLSFEYSAVEKLFRSRLQLPLDLE